MKRQLPIAITFTCAFILTIQYFSPHRSLEIMYEVSNVWLQIIGVFAICWMPHLVAKYQLRPQIDKCKANETTWMRCTKDRILHSQFVDKGPYGQTKGITYKEKADVIDDGSFPIRWLNGNPAILMYDNMNTNVDLNKSVARKIMKKKYGVRSGIEAYNMAKEKKEVLYPGRLEK